MEYNADGAKKITKSMMLQEFCKELTAKWQIL